MHVFLVLQDFLLMHCLMSSVLPKYCFNMYEHLKLEISLFRMEVSVQNYECVLCVNEWLIC